jgi:hypothetical protein
VARHLAGRFAGAALTIDVHAIVPDGHPTTRVTLRTHRARVVADAGSYRIVVELARGDVPPSRLLRLARDPRLVATT